MPANYKNPGRIQFTGKILGVEGGGAFVEFPDDVEAAYKKAGIREAYSSLSFSHQREYARWIEAAKQTETRARRIAKSIEKLSLMKAPK